MKQLLKMDYTLEFVKFGVGFYPNTWSRPGGIVMRTLKKNSIKKKNTEQLSGEGADEVVY